MASSIEELYGDLWGTGSPGLSEEAEESLKPRSADWLYRAFAQSGVSPNDLVLDVGSRDAGHAIELANRFGCRCVAIDPISLHREYMKKAIAESGRGDRISTAQAAIEALPFRDASVDAIWCRDVLNHVDLPRGFAECVRTLKPGGSMLIYSTLATDRCELKEAARLWDALAIVPENMDRDYLERCARAAGFEIAEADRIDSEWREHAIESGDQWGELKALLEIARMRRQEEELVQRYGRNHYEAAYAGKLWGIYQLLGKLCPMVYRLKKGPSPELVSPPVRIAATARERASGAPKPPALVMSGVPAQGPSAMRQRGTPGRSSRSIANALAPMARKSRAAVSPPVATKAPTPRSLTSATMQRGMG